MLNRSERQDAIELFKDFFLFRRAPNAKQWLQAPIEQTSDYSLAVVEFDDQGWYLDIEQRNALNCYLDEKDKYNENLLIVVFLHGWKHNAAPNDTSLRSFRAVLRDADTAHALCITSRNVGLSQSNEKRPLLEIIRRC
jgi:hypothetical protein